MWFIQLSASKTFALSSRSFRGLRWKDFCAPPQRVGGPTANRSRAADGRAESGKRGPRWVGNPAPWKRGRPRPQTQSPPPVLAGFVRKRESWGSRHCPSPFHQTLQDGRGHPPQDKKRPRSMVGPELDPCTTPTQKTAPFYPPLPFCSDPFSPLPPGRGSAKCVYPQPSLPGGPLPPGTQRPHNYWGETPNHRRRTAPGPGPPPLHLAPLIPASP